MVTRPFVETHARNTRRRQPRRGQGGVRRWAGRILLTCRQERRRWESNPHEAALQAAACAVWLQRQGSSQRSVFSDQQPAIVQADSWKLTADSYPQSVLARSRTWSSTFAGSRANPAHSEDIHFVFSTPPRNRTSSCRFEVCRADPAHSQGVSLSVPTWSRTRTRALGEPCAIRYTIGTNHLSRADDWICTSMKRFTKPLPRDSATSDAQSRRLDLRQHRCGLQDRRLCSATSASTSARIRTPCDGFGDRLLSQEHARVSARGLATEGHSA